MRSLFRFLIILHCIGRYRLVDLLPARHVLRYRILLSPFYLYPKTSISRGERLRCAFEELGPIFIKFGQILSTRPDIIPADIIDELTLLQDKVPPFDPQEFKVIAEKSLGASLDLAFQSFEPTPLASASIAQVHGAKLHDGANVVIKVVRPGIERIIEQDTKLLDVLAHWVEKLVKEGKRLRPVDVVRDYRDTIFDELDLVKEAANGSQLKRNFERDSNLYVPEVYWELTHRNVLVMERIYGIPINDINALKRQETDMKLLAERGVEIFFKQVFEHNFFHADMHPGNVFVSSENPKSPSYIAIDMAIVGSLSKEDQFYLARNMLAMFRRDYRQVAELHVQSGWVPKETSVSAFESAIRSVCEPIFQKPLKDISFGDALINLFRTAQRFNMPVQPQLVLLQKTLLNIEGLGRQLYPELDLWETAHPFLERWLKKRMSPTSIAREIKYHFPEWLEQFPEVPGLIVDNLVSGKKSLEQNNSDEYLYAYLEKKEKAAKSRKNMLSFALLVSAAASYVFFPSMLQLSSHIISISLIVLSALIIAL